MQPVNVLVVEDDAAIRRQLLEYLTQHPRYVVEGSRDGVEALHQIATRRYSVVILDLMMPKMSGVDLLDSLKIMTSDPSLTTLKAIPRIIVITAAPAEVLPARDLERRFPGLVRAVLRKPLDIALLFGLVEESAGH